MWYLLFWYWIDFTNILFLYDVSVLPLTDVTPNLIHDQTHLRMMCRVEVGFEKTIILKTGFIRFSYIFSMNKWFIYIIVLYFDILVSKCLTSFKCNFLSTICDWCIQIVFVLILPPLDEIFFYLSVINQVRYLNNDKKHKLGVML